MINPFFRLKSILLPLLVVLFITSCDTNENDVADEPSLTKNYQAIGDSLSGISQQTLLMNVSRELKSGGPVHAIDFCNLKVSSLMDSLSKKYDVTISRITSMPRNASNKATSFELGLLKSLESSSINDTVVSMEGQATYYKGITLGMPTCLKCHGSPQSDIGEETLIALQKHYPKDLAKNYQLGDFRGAWKIQFQD
ncbi:MAG: hypothetical protein ACI837_003367 [Crocinitomicaceae bacterium]|jgi:hypothetical protein